MEKYFEIDLGNGTKLCADGSDDPYKEIYVYLKKDGMVWQDLAIVSEAYDYVTKDGVYQNEPRHGKYNVYVYGDCEYEDYTNKFEIDEYKEGEEV